MIKIQNTGTRISLALFCCLLWGSAFPVIKLGYGLFQISNNNIGGQALFAGTRFFLAGGVIFLLFFLKEGTLPKLRRDNAAKVLGIGVFQIALQYLLFYIGLAHITGTRGALINACHGFITIIVAHYLIKAEPMTWQKVAGCVIGFAGIAVLNLGSGGASVTLLGDGMIIAATLIYGIFSVFIKIISKETSPMVITAYQLLSGGLLLMIAGWGIGGDMPIITWKGIALFLYLILISAAAFSIWNTLIKYNPIAKIAIFGSSIPAFAAILSALLLGEAVLTWQNLVALIGVSGGIFLVNWKVGSEEGDIIS